MTQARVLMLAAIVVLIAAFFGFDLGRYSDALKSYLATLSKVSQDEFGGWSKEQQLAFLINAYNVHMLGLILTCYPNINRSGTSARFSTILLWFATLEDK